MKSIKHQGINYFVNDVKRRITEGGIDQTTGIGPLIAKNISDFFAEQHNVDALSALKEVLEGVENPAPKRAMTSPISGKVIVFTGTLVTFSREEAKAEATSLGAIVTDSVSKRTDYVVAGSSAGSKLKKAQALNIPVLSEDQYLKLIGKLS